MFSHNGKCYFKKYEINKEISENVKSKYSDEKLAYKYLFKVIGHKKFNEIFYGLEQGSNILKLTFNNPLPKYAIKDIATLLKSLLENNNSITEVEINNCEIDDNDVFTIADKAVLNALEKKDQNLPPKLLKINFNNEKANLLYKKALNYCIEHGNRFKQGDSNLNHDVLIMAQSYLYGDNISYIPNKTGFFKFKPDDEVIKDLNNQAKIWLGKK